MADANQIKKLEADLSSARLVEIDRLASSGDITTDALDKIVALQIALTATRETISEHSSRVGWTGNEEELEKRVAETAKS